MSQDTATRAHRVRFRFRKLVAALVMLVGSTMAANATATLPSVTIGRAALVDPATAVTYYQNAPGGLTSPTRASDPDITTLAVALHNNIDNIYQWVHDNVELDLTFGLGKGARGAALDKSGTPFDQAQLMVELARAAGYTATYQFGTITLTGAQFTDWTGISDPTAAANILADGGIPATVSGSGTISTVTMLHCWVLVSIGGTQYAFDPSFKSHTVKTGMTATAIQTAMGFNGATMLASALSGSAGDTSLGPARARALNVASVASTMQTYSQNLLSYLRTTAPQLNGDLDDVIGGRHIVPTTLTPTRQSALSYQTAVTSTFANDIPYALRTKFTVTVTNPSGSSSQSLYFDQFYGKVLVITVNAGQWTLYGDKTALATFSITPALVNFSYAVDHPYAANTGSYMDRTITPPDVTGGYDSGSYDMIVYGLGTVGPDFAARYAQAVGDGIDQWNGQVDCEGACTSTWGPSGDASMVKSVSTFLTQYARMADIYAKMSGGFHQMHDMLGLASVLDSDGPGLAFHSSLKFNIETGFSFESLSNNAAMRSAAIAGLVSASSTLEGSVVEQTTATRDPASIAAKLDWLSRETTSLPSGSDWVYWASNSTDWNTIKSQLLQDYVTYTYDINGTPTAHPSSLVSSVGDAYIAAGYQLLIPISSNLGPGEDYHNLSKPPTPQFQDKGLERGGLLIAYKPDTSQIAYVIVRNGTTDKGGGGSADINTDPSQLFSPDVNFKEQQVKSRLKFYSVDPQTGTLTYTPPPDIVAGRGDFPNSLSFQRVFRSGKNGWTNNLISHLTVSGSGLSAMGGTGSFGAAETIAMVTAQLYLSPSTQSSNLTTLQGHMVAALVNMWWEERLAINSVTVTADNAEKTFTKLADNTYFAPGDASVLTGPVTRVFGPDPNVGGWYSLPMTLAPVATANDLDRVDPKTLSSQCPPTGTYRFTLTSKTGMSSNFDYLCSTIGATSVAQGYHRTSTTAPSGVSVTYTYNPSNQVTSVQNSLGRKLAWGTDGTGKYGIQDQSDPNNIRTVSFLLYIPVQSLYVTADFCDSDAHTPGDPSSICVAQIDRVNDAMGNLWNYTYKPGTGVTSYGQGPTCCAMGLGSMYAQLPLELQTALFPSDANNPKYTYAYDQFDRITSVTDALGKVWLYRSANGRRGESQDPINPNPDISTTLYDDRDHAVTTIDPVGNVKLSQGVIAVGHATYDGFGRTVTKTNPEGDFEQYAYDVRSNLTQTTRYPKPGSLEAGQGKTIVTSATYNEGPSVYACTNIVTCNLPASTTSPNLNTTNYSWNATTGLLTQVLLPADGNGIHPETDFGYTASGGAGSLLTSKTEKINGAQNLVTNYGYNSANFYAPQTLTVDPTGLNLITTFTFDTTGNVTAIDGPRTDVTDVSNFTWDTLRRPIFAIQPAPSGTTARPATRYLYTVDGYVSEVDRGTTTTATGSDFGTPIEAVTDTYDVAGDKIQETAPTSVTQYTYDDAARLSCTAVRMNPTVFGSLPASACTLSTAGPYGSDRITQLIVDADGRTLQEIRGLGTANQITYATHSYSPNGKEASVYDALGTTHTTSYAYDGFDRLITTTFPDATTEQLGNYDNDSNARTRINRSGQSITYTFDNLDRMLTKAVPASGSIPADTVTWTYDLKNRPLTLTDTLSNALTNCYDLLGRVTDSTSSTSGAVETCRAPLNTATSHTIQYLYDQAGNRTKIIWPDAYYVTYAWDALNHVTNAYENGSSTALASYGYDQLARRAYVQYINGARAALSWSSEDDLLTLAHTFTSSTNNVSFTDTYTPAHQINTNTITNSFYGWGTATSGTDSYATVNSLNQYPSVTPSGGSAQAMGFDTRGNLTSYAGWTYAYDPENRMMAATKSDNSVIAAYTYDPLGRRSKKSGTGVATTAFLDDGDNEIAEYDGSGNMLRRYISGPAVNDNIAMVDCRGVSGCAGSGVVKTYFHVDKLGSVVAMSDANGNLAEGPYAYDPYGNGASTAGVPFKFTGQRIDPETGLYYYRARYYAPAFGRFLQTDPVAYADDLDLYSYVGDDPTDRIDPTGKTWGDLLSWEGAEAAAETLGGAGVAVAGGLGISASIGITGGSGGLAVEVAVPLAIFSSGVVAAGGAIAEQGTQNLAGIINRQDETSKSGAPNPYGSKGAPDHQADVQGPGRAEAEDIAASKPGSTVATERGIGRTPNGEPINRRPDNQVRDENGVTTDVVETERHPNSTRVQQKIRDYNRCGINCIIRPLPKPK